MGINVKENLISRGYYPRGGGEAEITVNPSVEIKPASYEVSPKFSLVEGIVHQANLPDHVGTRIKHAAIKQLMKSDLTANITIQKVNSLSPGTGITLWARSGDVIIGETGLGERGLPAERVGEETASRLIREIKSGSTIDIHAFDQIIPYMALATKKGTSSCLLREISSHAKTNMWLVSQFCKNKEIFIVEKSNNLFKISTNKF